MGAVNMVTGIVSAVADVVNAIYSIRQEGTLNAIEKEVRYTQIHMSHVLDHVNAYLPLIESIKDFVWDTFSPAFASLMSTTEESRDAMKAVKGTIVDDAGDSIFTRTLTAVTDGFAVAGDSLRDIEGHLAATLQGFAALGRSLDVGNEISRNQTDMLREIAGAVRERQPMSVSITVSGAGNPNEVANRVASALRTQFAY